MKTLGTVLAVMVLLAGCAAPLQGAGGPAGGEVQCGRERWSVKTTTDGVAVQEAKPPRRVTVAQLAALEAPKWKETMPRAGVELEAVEVLAFLCGSKWEEGDGDYHLVIADAAADCGPDGHGLPDKTMIAEAPDPACAQGSPHLERMAQARAAAAQLLGVPGPRLRPVRPEPKRALLLGVPFWDKRHGQTGASGNGIELHPLLGVRAAP